MNVDRQMAETLSQLTPENLRYAYKLVCLVRFCPGFKEELKQLVPAGCGTVSPKQLTATDALMKKWLYKEGWAEILRPELERAGVPV